MLDRVHSAGVRPAGVKPPLRPGFAIPAHDLGHVLESIGSKLFCRERTLAQFVSWSVQMGLFALLEIRPLTAGEAAAITPLTEAGADSLFSVLCGLGLVTRSSDERYALTPVAREYFLSSSPYFIGDQIDAPGLPIPGPYVKQRTGFIARTKLRLLMYRAEFRFGSGIRLANQHARNLGACAAAVRTGEFARVRCLVDVAAGSGAFTIPFALEYPDKRVVLTELAQALPNIRPLLAEHGLTNQVELLALDAFRNPWNIPPCDGIFIGNFLHGFDDEKCRQVCREAFERLEHGGRLWVHEMIWNDTRDGPLLTALWHAAMRSVGGGRQRTAREISNLLQSCGFADIRTTPTSGPYALISASRP